VKILFVLEHFYPYIGGTEHLFYRLSNGLVEAGHHVTVITTKFDSDLPKKELYKGVNIIRIPCYNRFLFTFMALPEVIRQSKKHDLIHTTSYNAGFPSWIASKWTKTKVVITFHEVWAGLWWKLPFLNPIQRIGFYLTEWTLLRCSFNRWIAVSDYTRNCLIKHGVSPDKIELIYNGLDYETMDCIQKSDRSHEFTFLFYGRQGVSKGVDLILPAFEKLIKDQPNAKLKLVLSNKPTPISKWVNTFIKNNEKLKCSVVYMSNLTQEALYQEIADADCVLIPSYSEGFCYSAAEAVGLHTPIISSEKGALPEVVGGKYIAMKQMNSDGLYDAMQSALNENWQERPVKRFPLANFLNAHMEMYGSI
jgi:glycosyltransferase involved in cell wall biosynthesis